MTICWNISFFFEPVFALSLFIYLHFHWLLLQVFYIKIIGEHSTKGVTSVKLFSKVLKITSFWIFLIALVSEFKNHLLEKHHSEVAFDNLMLLITICNKHP